MVCNFPSRDALRFSSTADFGAVPVLNDTGCTALRRAEEVEWEEDDCAWLTLDGAN